MAAAGVTVEEAASLATFTADELRRSTVLEFGTMYLLHIAEQIGLQEALQRAVPNLSAEILILACYLVITCDPFLYREEWISKTAGLEDVGSLSSQRISEVLQTITLDQREGFYHAWCQLRSEQEYLGPRYHLGVVVLRTPPGRGVGL